MKQSKAYKLSPSGLNLLKDCARCFWLEKNKGVKRPRGIFPSLPGGMDLVIKNYFDSYRAKNKLPPELGYRLKGRLFPDIKTLEKWRNWLLTDLFYEDKECNSVLRGALDDCLVDEGFYMPIDYKTRGSELKSDPREYYQTQLDCYTLMLESSGFKTNGLAYLVYYWPLDVRENGMVRFNVELIKVETDIARAKRLVKEAAKILSSDIPKASSSCEYCMLVTQRKNDL